MSLLYLHGKCLNLLAAAIKSSWLLEFIIAVEQAMLNPAITAAYCALKPLV
jgi:hypothetical protein